MTGQGPGTGRCTRALNCGPRKNSKAVAVAASQGHVLGCLTRRGLQPRQHIHLGTTRVHRYAEKRRGGGTAWRGGARVIGNLKRIERRVLDLDRKTAFACEWADGVNCLQRNWLAGRQSGG